MQALLGRVAFVEMIPEVLGRALLPFPVPVRTLDALHLASAEFIRSQGEVLAVATYDQRLLVAARALDFQIADV